MCSLVNTTLGQHRIFTQVLEKISIKYYTGIPAPSKSYLSHVANYMNVGFFIRTNTKSMTGYRTSINISNVFKLDCSLSLISTDNKISGECHMKIKLTGFVYRAISNKNKHVFCRNTTLNKK